MKRFLIVILSIALAFSCLGVSAFAAGNGDRVNSYLNINTVGDLQADAGKEFDVKLQLDTSTYGGTAKVTISGDGFTMSGHSTQVEKKVSNAADTIDFKVIADSALYKGEYLLTVNVTYTALDEKGFVLYEVTASREFRVTVNSEYTGPEEPPEEEDLTLVITNAYVSGNGIVKNGNGSISYGIQVNEAGGTAYASIESTGIEENSYYGSNSITVSNNSASGTLPIICMPSAQAGMNKITLTVTYVKGSKQATATKTINVNVIDPSESEIEGTPGVSLTITSAPENVIMPGDTFRIDFTTKLNNIEIINTWNYHSIVEGLVTISGEGFTLAGALAQEEISTGNASIEVLCDEGAVSGRQQFTVEVEFKVDGESYTASRIVNVDVVKDEEEKEEVDESKEHANFSLVSASIPEKKGRSNLSTKLTMVFKNNTDYTAENLKVKLAGLGDIILNTYTDTAEAGDVKGGESVTASFPIKFAEYPTVQTKLDVEVSYDSIAGPQTETFSVYLQATEKKKEDETVPEDKKSLKPKVIVSSYSVEADNEKNEVVSGEEFTLKIVLENTSVDKDLRNMTVNVTPGANYNTGTNGSGASGGPVFSFIDGTSSFYTDMFEKS